MNVGALSSVKDSASFLATITLRTSAAVEAERHHSQFNRIGAVHRPLFDPCNVRQPNAFAADADAASRTSVLT
jgi:hypothetical protein